MNDDYQDFLSSTAKNPNKAIDEKVLSYVEDRLNPGHKTVFLKLFSVQAFIGFITMLFCPQFNFSLTNNHDLFHYFHHNYGESICMIICGTIFMGTGAFFASFLLKKPEVAKIHQSVFLYYMALSIVALSIFFALGATIYLNLVAFWIVGAISSGVLFFEISKFTSKNILINKKS